MSGIWTFGVMLKGSKTGSYDSRATCERLPGEGELLANPCCDESFAEAIDTSDEKWLKGRRAQKLYMVCFFGLYFSVGSLIERSES